MEHFATEPNKVGAKLEDEDFSDICISIILRQMLNDLSLLASTNCHACAYSPRAWL